MECVVYDRMDYGGFWRRSFAHVLDLIILGIVFYVIAELVYLITPSKFHLKILVIVPVTFVAYMIGFKIYTCSTPSYRILGMEIVSMNGAEVNVKQRVVRLLSSIFSFLLFYIGFIWIVFDKRRQTWHDKITGTYVIKYGAKPVRTEEFS